MKLLLRSSLAPALAFSLALVPAAHAQAPARDPVQQQFVEAMQAMEAGRPGEATTILAMLAVRSDAPRIRLELARALYFSGRLREARTEFLKVYRRGDLPYAVRRTVNTFLADIDQRAGYVEPTLALVVDSNPLQTPPSGEYDIFGIPLTYESDAETLTGLRVETEGALPIGRAGLTAVGGAGVTRFADPDRGQYTLNAGLRRLDDGRRGSLTAGASYFERLGSDPATTAYIQRVKRLTLPDQSRQVIVRAAVSYTDVRNLDHLDGWGLEGGADYGFDLSPNAAVNLALGFGSAGAQYAFDRRLYANLGAGLTVGVPRWNKALTLGARLGATRYGDADPLFAKVRDDRTLSLEARLLDGRPVHGLFPSVSLTWGRRFSSIGFFDYRQAGFNLGLQRRF